MNSLGEQNRDLIVAAQTIPSIDFVLRELVDNSIDSGATQIDVYFENFGLDGLCVNDDGCGINKESFNKLCNMGATSKISKYADINQLKTKGFRGKALFSISKLCDLKISTKIQSSDSGYELFFEKEGAKFTEKIVVMTTGTKVEVRELYCTLPVRKKDLETKIRSYFSKCLIYLQHMCLLHLDIRFQIHNKKRNVDKEIILATLHNNSLTSTIIRIFSLKSKNSLVEIKDSNEFTYRGKSYSFAIEGILNCEKSSNSNTNSDSSFLQQRHFFFLNRRIWTNLKLVKRINKILLNFVEKRNMYAVLFISTTASCDFNVSTNKEKIYVEYEDELIDFIVKKIESDITTFFVSQRQTYPTSSSQTIIESFAEVNSSIKSANNSANSILENSFVDDLSNYPSSTQIVGGNDQKIMQQSTLSQSPNLQKYKFLKNTQPLPSVPTNYLKHFMDRKQESNNINDVFSMHCVPSKISIDIDSLKNYQKSMSHSIENKPKLTCLIMEKDTGKLQKKISKELFNKFEIIGQFNNGFIIVKLGNRYFIIDQHGADERYNFDDYISNPNFQSQDLVCPVPLQLGILQKHLFEEKIEFFRSLGYDFGFQSNDIPNDPGNILITKVPSTSNMIFKVEDLVDSIDSVRNYKNIDPSHLIPNHLREKMASKACRKSIMIGTPLNLSTMKKVVKNLNDVKYPWVCAHGRPIIQHVFNLE